MKRTTIHIFAAIALLLGLAACTQDEYIHRVRYGVTIIHTAALFRCSTGKQQILGYR